MRPSAHQEIGSVSFPICHICTRWIVRQTYLPALEFCCICPYLHFSSVAKRCITVLRNEIHFILCRYGYYKYRKYCKHHYSPYYLIHLLFFLFLLVKLFFLRKGFSTTIQRISQISRIAHVVQQQYHVTHVPYIGTPTISSPFVAKYISRISWIAYVVQQ